MCERLGVLDTYNRYVLQVIQLSWCVSRFAAASKLAEHGNDHVVAR